MPRSTRWHTSEAERCRRSNTVKGREETISRRLTTEARGSEKQVTAREFGRRSSQCAMYPVCSVAPPEVAICERMTWLHCLWSAPKTPSVSVVVHGRLGDLQGAVCWPVQKSRRHILTQSAIVAASATRIEFRPAEIAAVWRSPPICVRTTLSASQAGSASSRFAHRLVVHPATHARQLAGQPCPMLAGEHEAARVL